MSLRMPKPIHRVTTVVRGIEPVSDGVLAFELADPDDWDLPPFTAGAHVDVHVPGGLVRQYSLYGDPDEANRYRIAVRHEESGRGGSRSLHRDVAVGDTLPVSLPRNHFALRDAAHHVLIAGGIGVTPILSMIPVLERQGASFEVHYASRSPAATPFRDRLAPLVASGRLHRYGGGRAGSARLDLPALFGGMRTDAHAYVCGPLPMVREAVRIGEESLPGRLHAELFGGEGVGAPSDPDYTVELVRSNRLVVVPRGLSMLSALREAGLDIPASCEGGVCLECKTRYLAGQPVHRDLTLPAAERREYLTPCVSGSAGERIALDL